MKKFRAGFGKSGAAIWARVWRAEDGVTFYIREVFMRRLVVPLVIVAPLLMLLAGGAGRGALRAEPQDGGAQPPGGRQGAVKVTITTGGGLFGPPKESYRAGQRIPVVISMTNEGREPVYVCDSSSLYQDRPRLVKDGQPVPYLEVQESMEKTDEREKTCEQLDVPELRLLRPGETAVVDWFILTEGDTSQGDMAWYGSLGPGKYELSTQRRLGCCEGPWVESNKISFEVVP